MAEITAKSKCRALTSLFFNDSSGFGRFRVAIPLKPLLEARNAADGGFLIGLELRLIDEQMELSKQREHSAKI
ncbi:unnamed protein product [Brassica oleracea]|uniref:(rape) hypothetical protein n=1 Tax=Brassica napus TaxID=3708 RepID=A0A816L1N2_BRANA|nr:unnamed protein product [Brassica napus]